MDSIIEMREGSFFPSIKGTFLQLAVNNGESEDCSTSFFLLSQSPAFLVSNEPHP